MDNNNWNPYEQSQEQNPYQQQSTPQQQNPYGQPGMSGQQNPYQQSAPYMPGGSNPQYSGYPGPAYQQYKKEEEPVKISEYLLILGLCTFLPCVGIILLFVFAFSKDEKESKRNFCKAYLIVMGIAFALILIYLIINFALLAALL